MIITLNKETNMRLMQMDDNAYLISMYGEAKMIIDTISQDEDVLFKFTIKDNCKLEEFVQILDDFSNYYFFENPNVQRILVHGEEPEILDKIGFKPVSDESEYLYKDNILKTEFRKGKK